MLLLVVTVVGLAAARPQYRTTLDEEELIHALQFRQEALDMEKEVEVAAVESRHVVEPAPLESRHIGAGLGLQLGPIGAGLSTGLGNGGLGFNTGAGLGQYLQFGTPAHYQQYWARPATVGATQSGPWVPVPAQSRLGTGGGINHGFQSRLPGAGFGGPYSNSGIWHPAMLQ